MTGNLVLGQQVERKRPQDRIGQGWAEERLHLKSMYERSTWRKPKIMGITVSLEFYLRFNDALMCPWSLVFGRYGFPPIPMRKQRWVAHLQKHMDNGHIHLLMTYDGYPELLVEYGYAELLVEHGYAKEVDRAKKVMEEFHREEARLAQEQWEQRQYGSNSYEEESRLFNLAIEDMLEANGVDLDLLFPLDKYTSHLYRQTLSKEVQKHLKLIAAQENVKPAELKRKALDTYLIKLGY